MNRCGLAMGEFLLEEGVVAERGIFFNHIFGFGAGGFHHFYIFYGFHLAI